MNTLINAIKYYNEEQFNIALNLFEFIISIDNKSQLAYQYIGHINFREENYFIAIENYSKAIELDNNEIYYECLIDRGVCYLNSGDIENALIDFNNYLAYNPSEEDVIKMKLYCEFTKMDLQPKVNQFN